MKVDEILAKLHDVKLAGTNDWWAKCPAHQDDKASLGVRYFPSTQYTNLKCFAGCGKSQIVQALGIRKSDLFANPTSAGGGNKTIAAVYEYVDETGNLLFQAVRYQPKDFRYRQPDGNGGWIYSLEGARRVPFRLPELIQAVSQGQMVFLPEGEKDARNVAEQLGLDSTCNPGGAGKWDDSFTPFLANSVVVILPDNDEPGRNHAELVAGKLRGTARSIKVVNLPNLPEKGDVSDWIAAGGTKKALLDLAAGTPEWAPPKVLPTIHLPGGRQSITSTARELGKVMGRTLTYVTRSGEVVRVHYSRNPALPPELVPVKAEHLQSAFEAEALLVDAVGKPTVCPASTARAIMYADAFQDGLLRVETIVNCPVLIQRDGSLVELTGYDNRTGILAHGNTLPVVQLAEAIELINQVLRDFRFPTEGDRSRAIAGIVQVAMIPDQLFRGRTPMLLIEADASQSGKTFFAKLVSAIYNQPLAVVTQKRGGVGGFDEAYSEALVKGAFLILIDNTRQKIDSPLLEAAITAETIQVRVPYRNAIDVDIRHVQTIMTSNQASLTKDLANRTSIIRILKQPPTREFTMYPEGSILDHIQRNQPAYLAAVFRVVREWYSRGRPETAEHRHAFRGWARPLDWIVIHIFGSAPLLDGHESTANRVSTQTFNWLRDVAIAVKRAGKLDQWMRTAALVEIVYDDPDAELPALAESDDITDHSVASRVQQQVGFKLHRCFKDGETQEIDDIVVTRRLTPDNRPGHSEEFVKEYYFTLKIFPPTPPTPPTTIGNFIPSDPIPPCDLPHLRSTEPVGGGRGKDDWNGEPDEGSIPPFDPGDPTEEHDDGKPHIDLLPW